MSAQELEPRAYLPYPVGTNVVALSLTNSRGDVVTDPTLPVEDAQARINAASLGYVRGFGLFGRSANMSIGVPYAWGSAQGLIAGDLARVTRSGMADARLRFSINLRGAPRMTAKEFQKYRFKSVLATSLVVSPPSGQYDPARLVNLGTNRWSIKPELGYTRALSDSGHWVLDAYAGVWFFTSNQDFVSGPRSQNPMLSTQLHLNYRVTRRMWVAFNSTFFAGGSSTVANQPKQDRQQTLRIGSTVLIPIRGAHSLKFSYSRGAVVLFGGNFTNIGVAYQYVWLSR